MLVTHDPKRTSRTPRSPLASSSARHLLGSHNMQPEYQSASPPELRAMSLPIGVVGGGFTGGVFCVHLANISSVPLDIEVIEPREQVGFGLAYGSCGEEHRI